MKPCESCRFLHAEACRANPPTPAVIPHPTTGAPMVIAVYPPVQDPTAPGCGRHEGRLDS